MYYIIYYTMSHIAYFIIINVSDVIQYYLLFRYIPFCNSQNGIYLNIK